MVNFILYSENYFCYFLMCLSYIYLFSDFINYKIIIYLFTNITTTTQEFTESEAASSVPECEQLQKDVER